MKINKYTTNLELRNKIRDYFDIPLITVTDLFQSTEYYSGMRKEVVLSKNRKREIILLRQAIAVILYAQEKNYKLKQIGKVLSKDHATVIHAVNHIKNEMDGFGCEIKETINGIIWYYKNRLVVRKCNECKFQIKVA